VRREKPTLAYNSYSKKGAVTTWCQEPSGNRQRKRVAEKEMGKSLLRFERLAFGTRRDESRRGAEGNDHIRTGGAYHSTFFLLRIQV